MIKLGFGVTVLARCLQNGGVDGIGSYTRELMKRFLVAPDIELVPISFGYTLPMLNGVAQDSINCGRFARSAAICAISGLPFPKSRQIGQKINLMHATDHLIPNFGNTPVVATLMDAIPLSHPEWVTMNLRSIKNALWRRSAQWASHVITISEYSKQQIEQHFAVPAHKISVTPLGVDERWFQAIAAETMQQTLRLHGLPDQFFLFVGTLQPRKNVKRVIEAYRCLPQGIQNTVALVIVGRAGWQCDDVVNTLSSNGYGKSVFWLKHLPDDQLLSIVKAATALVFPSLYEGFGLPVLEAFAAGTPVITSNTTSLPEVAGDAALLVNPVDTSSIAAAMQEVLENPVLADTLRKKGYVRALEHSWQRTASMTQDVYRQVLG